MFYLEKAFLPLLAFIALVSGLAFGSVIPILFLVVPIVLMPLLMYFYTQVYKYRYKQLVEDESPLEKLQDAIGSKVVDLDERRTVIRYTGTDKNTETAENIISAQNQIAEITARDLESLTESMPANGTLTQHFTSLAKNQWMYRFHFKSFGAEFNAIGIGPEPKDAFAVAKQVLQRQVREWHVARAQDQEYVGEANNEILDNVSRFQDNKPVQPGATTPSAVGVGRSSAAAATASQAQESASAVSLGEVEDHPIDRKHIPTVLIVEDDPDIAAATASIFKQLGCKTIISDGHDGTSHKMSFQDVDFIVLDWMLGNDLSADQLVKKSSRIIDAFKDLKSRFTNHHAKVITYSAMDRSKIHLPDSRYFDHIDHWQKPVRFNELAKRASDLLMANGY